MSISLNEHENRIRRLESAASGGYSETVLFNGSAVGNTTINLSQSIDSFKMIYLDYYHTSQTRGSNKCLTIPVSRLRTRDIDIYMGGDGKSELGRHIYLKLVSDKQLGITPFDVVDVRVYRVVGINIWGGV